MWTTLKFKEWLSNIDAPVPLSPLSDVEVANLYFHNSGMKVREISEKTGRSIGEVYRILHKFGSPNRQISNHENVFTYAASGMSVGKIADFTGYTPRNIRYILKKNEINGSNSF